MSMQEIKRITQELKLLEVTHTSLDEELGRVIQSGHGEHFKIVWVYDRSETYPFANLYMVASEDKEFIKNLEFGLSDDILFSSLEEYIYYDGDGNKLKTQSEIYVTMMDFDDWRTTKISKEGKFEQIKSPKEDVQRVLPVRIKDRVINLLEL